MGIPVETDHKTRRAVWMIYLLIGANILVFFLPIFFTAFQIATAGDFADSRIMIERFGYRPSQPTIEALFVSMFIHSSWLHLLANMYFLNLFGDNVEDIIGPIPFLIFYLGCGMAGEVCHALLFPQSSIPSIGASAAISGIMGLYVIFFPFVKVEIVAPISITSYFPIKPSAFVWFVSWIGLNFFLGARGVLRPNPGDLPIAYFAHIGGAVAGLILGLISLSLGLSEDAEDYTLSGYDDLEAVGEERGMGLGSDFVASSKSLIFQFFAGYWLFLFNKDYRDKKAGELNWQSRTWHGKILVFLELLLTAVCGIGVIIVGVWFVWSAWRRN